MNRHPNRPRLLTPARSVALPVAWAVALLVAGAGAEVAAQTRYDVQTQGLFGAKPGLALVTLATDIEEDPWLSAEALVWTGFDSDLQGDALIVSVRATDPEGRGSAKFGRFVVMPGALRPLHIDGAYGRLNLPWELSLEVFGGVPVVPEWQDRSFDWTAGTRVARSLGTYGSVGLAYMHRREGGVLADEELGLDAGGAALDWLDLNSRVSVDLIDLGISELRASAVARSGPWRGELFTWQRSPSRILLATSIFSVLGDTPSRRVGLSGQWHAAPRLDLAGTTAVHLLGDEPAEALSLRADLRIGELADGMLSAELRREGSPDGGWTGARASGRVKMSSELTLSTELEVALADEPGDRGTLWPWGSLALAWAFRPGWEVAGAVQASASPEVAGRLDGLVRLTHQLGSDQ